MFHKTADLKFKEGTVLEVTFQDGKVIQYDMSSIMNKHPAYRELRDRELFESGRLMNYGIIWNDELDIEAETIYEDGELLKTVSTVNTMVGKAVSSARAKSNLSQKELSALTGIDQSDLSKIERGVANPSVATLHRIADALNAELKISIE